MCPPMGWYVPIGGHQRPQTRGKPSRGRRARRLLGGVLLVGPRATDPTAASHRASWSGQVRVIDLLGGGMGPHLYSAAIKLPQRIHDLIERHRLRGKRRVSKHRRGIDRTGVGGPGGQDRALFGKRQPCVREDILWMSIEPCWVEDPVKFAVVGVWPGRWNE
jgi:hypothetical protein